MLESLKLPFDKKLVQPKKDSARQPSSTLTRYTTLKVLTVLRKKMTSKKSQKRNKTRNGLTYSFIKKTARHRLHVRSSRKWWTFSLKRQTFYPFVVPRKKIKTGLYLTRYTHYCFSKRSAVKRMFRKALQRPTFKGYFVRRRNRRTLRPSGRGRMPGLGRIRQYNFTWRALRRYKRSKLRLSGRILLCHQKPINIEAITYRAAVRKHFQVKYFNRLADPRLCLKNRSNAFKLRWARVSAAHVNKGLKRPLPHLLAEVSKRWSKYTPLQQSSTVFAYRRWFPWFLKKKLNPDEIEKDASIIVRSVRAPVADKRLSPLSYRVQVLPPRLVRTTPKTVLKRLCRRLGYEKAKGPRVYANRGAYFRRHLKYSTKQRKYHRYYMALPRGLPRAYYKAQKKHKARMKLSIPKRVSKLFHRILHLRRLRKHLLKRRKFCSYVKLPWYVKRRIGWRHRIAHYRRKCRSKIKRRARSYRKLVHQRHHYVSLSDWRIKRSLYRLKHYVYGRKRRASRISFRKPHRISYFLHGANNNDTFEWKLNRMDEEYERILYGRGWRLPYRVRRRYHSTKYDFEDSLLYFSSQAAWWQATYTSLIYRKIRSASKDLYFLPKTNILLPSEASYFVRGVLNNAYRKPSSLLIGRMNRAYFTRKLKTPRRTTFKAVRRTLRSKIRQIKCAIKQTFGRVAEPRLVRTSIKPTKRSVKQQRRITRTQSIKLQSKLILPKSTTINNFVLLHTDGSYIANRNVPIYIC